MQVQTANYKLSLVTNCCKFCEFMKLVCTKGFSYVFWLMAGPGLQKWVQYTRILKNALPKNVKPKIA